MVSPDVVEDGNKILVFLAPHLGEQHLRQLALLPRRRLEGEATVQEYILWHPRRPPLRNWGQPAQDPKFIISQPSPCSTARRSVSIST